MTAAILSHLIKAQRSSVGASRDLMIPAAEARKRQRHPPPFGIALVHLRTAQRRRATKRREISLLQFGGYHHSEYLISTKDATLLDLEHLYAGSSVMNQRLAHTTMAGIHQRPSKESFFQDTSIILGSFSRPINESLRIWTRDMSPLHLPAPGGGHGDQAE